MIDRSRGDTLIEVLISIAILSAAAVGGFSLMNRGLGIVLDSIERTQVQARLTSQLSLIQYARDAYINANKQSVPGQLSEVWPTLLGSYLNPSSFGGIDNVCSNTDYRPVLAPRNFYIDENGAFSGGLTTGDIATHTTTAGVPNRATTVPVPGTGIWVEAVEGTVANARYVDFYAKACWTPTSGTVAQQSKSVMRLYVP